MRTQAELDQLRERAVALRRAGKSVREIKAALGPVGNRTLNELLKGEPPPAWTRRPNAKEGEPQALGRGGPPVLGGRELLIAGAIAYWCEGTKSKPHRQSHVVVFVNSDPGLIRLFLRFLDNAGVLRSDLPSHQRPPQQHPLAQDRGLGTSHHDDPCGNG